MNLKEVTGVLFVLIWGLNEQHFLQLKITFHCLLAVLAFRDGKIWNKLMTLENELPNDTPMSITGLLTGERKAGPNVWSKFQKPKISTSKNTVDVYIPSETPIGDDGRIIDEESKD